VVYRRALPALGGFFMRPGACSVANRDRPSRLAGSPFGGQHMECFVRLPVVTGFTLLEEASW